MAAWWLIPLAGFTGSFHCAAMCGPFVGFYSLGARGSDTWRHLAYQAGRLCSYLSLGVVAGVLGRGLYFLGDLLQVQRALMLLMGLLMVAAGLAYYLPWRRERRSRFAGLASRLLAPLGPARATPLGAALVGLCSTLLPCGFLYSFVLVAATAGHPLQSAGVMFGFWAGTLPLLLAAGFLLKNLSAPALRRFQGLTPLFLILFGLLAIVGKWLALPDLPGYNEILCRGPFG